MKKASAMFSNLVHSKLCLANQSYKSIFSHLQTLMFI